jgi:hypothetical protein
LQRQWWGGAREQRKVLVQCSERWQGFVQRLRSSGSEVLKYQRQVAPRMATWRSLLMTCGRQRSQTKARSRATVDGISREARHPRSRYRRRFA